jgi:hypothetical protein
MLLRNLQRPPQSNDSLCRIDPHHWTDLADACNAAFCVRLLETPTHGAIVKFSSIGGPTTL